MRVAALVAVVLAIGACKKSSEKASDPSADMDALWKLAPDDTVLGVVGSPAATAHLESGWLALIDLMKAAPEVAADAQLEMQKTLGTTNPSFETFGLTRNKGFAWFIVRGGKQITIMPIADLDKTRPFMKIAALDKVTCKPVKNVYACTEDASLFDRLGKGDLSPHRKLLSGRGDIEWAGPVPTTPLSQAGFVTFGRGSIVVRMTAKPWPAQITRLVTNAKPRTNGDKTAGFSLFAGGDYVQGLQAMVPSFPLVHGVTLDALAKSVEGPITMTVDNVASHIDLRVPLSDPAPARQLLEQCDQLPRLRGFATVNDGTCHIAIPETSVDIDGWVEGTTLHIGKKLAEGEPAPALPLSPAAKELAAGEWLFATFGRGSHLSAQGFRLPPPFGTSVDGRFYMRLLSTLNEVGIGARLDGDAVQVVATIRTIWSNPDDVVAELLAIDPTDVAIGKGDASAKSVADRHPTSPFASDYKCGASGLQGPTMIAAMIAAAVIRYRDSKAAPAPGE